MIRYRKRKEKILSSWLIIILLLGVISITLFIGLKLSEFTLSYGGVNVRVYDIPDSIIFGKDVSFKVKISDTRSIETNKEKYSFVYLAINHRDQIHGEFTHKTYWLKAGESRDDVITLPFSAFKSNELTSNYCFEVEAEIVLYEFSPITGEVQLKSSLTKDEYNVKAIFNLASNTVRYVGYKKGVAGYQAPLTTTTQGIATVPEGIKTTTTKQTTSIVSALPITTTKTYSYSTFKTTQKITSTYSAYIPPYLFQPSPLPYPAFAVLEAGGKQINVGETSFDSGFVPWNAYYGANNLFEYVKTLEHGKITYQYSPLISGSFRCRISTATTYYDYVGDVSISVSKTYGTQKKVVSIPIVAMEVNVNAPSSVSLVSGEEFKGKVTITIKNPTPKTINYKLKKVGELALKEFSLASGQTYTYEEPISFSNYIYASGGSYGVKDYNYNYEINAYYSEVAGFIQSKSINLKISVNYLAPEKPKPSPTIIATTTTSIRQYAEMKIISYTIPNQVEYNQPYQIIATVKNVGNIAGECEIQIFHSQDIDQIGKKITKTLNPGETLTFSREDIVFKGTVGVTSRTWRIIARTNGVTTDWKSGTTLFVSKVGDIDYSLLEKDKDYYGTEKITISSNIPISGILDDKGFKSGESLELVKATHKLSIPNKVVYEGKIYQLKEVKLNDKVIGTVSPITFSGSGSINIIYEEMPLPEGGKVEPIQEPSLLPSAPSQEEIVYALSEPEKQELQPQITQNTQVSENNLPYVEQRLEDKTPIEKVDISKPVKPLFEINLMQIAIIIIIVILGIGIFIMFFKIISVKRGGRR